MDLIRYHSYNLSTKSLYLVYTLLIFVYAILWQSMNSEINLKRVVFFYDIVFPAVSRDSFNIVVVTFVPVPVQFLRMPSTSWEADVV